MSNILTAKVTIRGTRPLMWHWFGPDAIPLEKVEKAGVAGNDPTEWRRSCLVTKDGQLFLNSNYVFGTVQAGGKFVPRKRSNIMAAITATLQVAEDRILIDRYMPGFPNGHDCNLKTVETPDRDASAPTYLDVRSVVNPQTKGRNVRYRVAAAPGWQTTFTLQWDKTVVSRGEMEAALIESGHLVGIGSGRKIGMGRFEIVSFVVNE